METGLAGVYNDFSGLSSLRHKAQSEPENAAREVAQQFESIFISMMLKSMRSAVPKDSLFSSDQAEAYQDMFDIGLARIIEQQIAGRPKQTDNDSGS